ncbi:hypothetical protein B0T14DRAFT_33585 [Immersiella caudata]|uniref:Uncharacterized protein n=1 Tax=Immersiella caudata TaxID=314043 RepID=A0AA40CBM4_9PEZI|nr:hypothetical protein B0T14DRAFT_33585 [Immersiella caudata]
MPPHLPRAALSGILPSSKPCLRASSSATVPASISWSTRRQSRTAASPFSTTAPTADAPVPPESPKFIRLPVPPQTIDDREAPLRGHLPVPRDIFPKREGQLKMKPGYVEAATQFSKAEKAGLPPKSESEAQHRIEAAVRREAFAAGLKGLWKRKDAQVRQAKARTSARIAINKKASMKPERRDEILTRSTFGPPSVLSTAVELDPLRFKRAEQARKQHEAITAAKADARRDALTQLYVSAGDFIVDEQELEERINKIFSSEAFPSLSGKLGNTNSIWDTGVVPISVSEVRAEMFSGSLGDDSIGGTWHRSEAHKTAERQKKVAEELTGGKL